MEKIRFAAFDDNVVHPTRKNPTDAGIDLYPWHPYSIEEILPGQIKIINTGLSVEIPDGYFGWITNKSKNDFLIGGGIVDSGYQGELLVKVINVTNDLVVLERDKSFAQLLIIPCKILDIEVVDLIELHKNSTKRGKDGGIARQKQFENLKGY